MKKIILAIFVVLSIVPNAIAQSELPRDKNNPVGEYHSSPAYRESESHPFRLVAYAFHPIGWLLREGIARPISYLISSNDTSKSIFGYRDEGDWKEPSCFNNGDIPDCRTIPPYNYDDGISACSDGSCGNGNNSSKFQQVYLPDVNFDFDKRELNTLGKGKARVIAKLLNENKDVKIVLSGHADFKGSKAYNDKLAMDRAETLKRELVSLGVDEDRIQTLSFGKEKPTLLEKDDPARAVNRRVEVSF